MKKFILSLIAVLLIFLRVKKKKKVSIPSNEEEKRLKLLHPLLKKLKD